MPSISVTDVPDGAYILDVREFDEWEAGHTPGAHHVPMMTIPAHIADVPTDEQVGVLCRHGNRSAQVVGFLASRGLNNLVNLDGGITEWVAAGRPIVTDDGREPFVA